jgi:hypothetical protein
MIKNSTADVVYIERLFCDKCGKEMRIEPYVLMTFPEQYVYICDCGHKENSTTKFPNPVIGYHRP